MVEKVEPKAMRIVAGLDIGNGYVKGKATVDGAKTPVLIDLPSAVSYTVGSDIPQIPSDEFLSTFENELDATIVSRAINQLDAGRVFFGQRGIRSGESLREFNIENHVPKCQDALSTMLVLGSLASAAIRGYWAKKHKLPQESLSVEATIGIALPIEDFMEWKDVYKTTLMGESHHVTVHNFDHNIDVVISIKDVEVLAEGAAAQYAIAHTGPDFLQMALDEARANGAQIDASYTGKVLVQAKNTIGIDIGEGTTNFPVFHHGAVSIESSTSINKGYGSVLTAVVASLRNTRYAFDSRKALADFMLDDNVMPAQKTVQKTVQHYIDNQVVIFARELMKEYTNIFRKVGLRTEVIYVYGGGANDVKNTLYPMIIEASTLADGNCLPVIYLDSTYSRDLNRTGLYEVASLGAQAIGW
jgi:hypothetical protein